MVPTRAGVLLCAILAGASTTRDAASQPGAGDAAPADTSHAAPAPSVDVRGIGGGRVFARARIDLPAPPHRVFDLVSDYDRLGEFVSAIDTSRVLRRDSTGVLVRQVGRTKLILQKTVHMTLRFRAEPPARLWFEIVDGDFRTYAGSWRFEPHATGTRLTYDVTFTAPELVPEVLVRRVVARDLRTMLHEVAVEMRRRANGGGTGIGP